MCFITLYENTLEQRESGSLPGPAEHDACGWQPPLLTEQMSMSVHTLPSPWYPDHTRAGHNQQR